MTTGINGRGGKKSGHVGIQLTLRDQVNFDPTDELKVAMQEALRGCPLSREQVVDEMNRLAAIAGIATNGRAQRVTVAILDKWVARGASAHVIPVRYLRIFCHLTGSVLPLQAFLPRGAEIVSGDDLACLRWAKAELELRAKRQEVKRLAQEVGIE